MYHSSAAESEIISGITFILSCSFRRTLAKLEGADRAFCFTSGMAALATVSHLAEAGQYQF